MTPPEQNIASKIRLVADDFTRRNGRRPTQRELHSCQVQLISPTVRIALGAFCIFGLVSGISLSISGSSFLALIVITTSVLMLCFVFIGIRRSVAQLLRSLDDGIAGDIVTAVAVGAVGSAVASVTMQTAERIDSSLGEL